MCGMVRDRQLIPIYALPNPTVFMVEMQIDFSTDFKLIPWFGAVFLEHYVVIQLEKICLHFLRSEVSLPCSQRLVIGPYPEQRT
jgi:hypothetical protein